VDAVGVVVGAAGVRPRILLIAPRDSYRIAPYIAASRALNVDLLIASEGRHAISGFDVPGLQLGLDSTTAVETILAAGDFAAIIGTDDASIELAAQASAALGLPHNPPDSVRLSRRKDLARECLASAGVRIPQHWRIDLDHPIDEQLARIHYPCVLKPVALSASRGVIRADNEQQLLDAIERVQRLLAYEKNVVERKTLLVEEFVPGQEVAVEGMLSNGRLEVLAIFDKPDPLDGPFFEETYYITPSRHPSETCQDILAAVADACRAYGLCDGPIHAECRINETGVWVIEVAARTIGGLCGRLLRFGTGYGLEELVLQHALGRQPGLQREAGGAGVLMIPIPHAGILRRVEGLLAAQRVPFVQEVIIDVREGYELVPLPEGSSYLGFIFARAPSPAEAEAALRAAHACLRIVVAPMWKMESA